MNFAHSVTLKSTGLSCTENRSSPLHNFGRLENTLTLGYVDLPKVRSYYTVSKTHLLVSPFLEISLNWAKLQADCGDNYVSEVLIILKA